MPTQALRLVALVAACALAPGAALAGVKAIDPARRLALFVGNAETAGSLHELARVLVQSFGYAQPLELYGEAATQDAIRQSLSRVTEEATRFDSVTVVFGLSSLRLSPDPFGLFLVPTGGSTEQPWTLLPVGEIEKFLAAGGRAATTLLVVPACPTPSASRSEACPYTSGDRTLTTISVCVGARGEERLMSRFVQDASRVLSDFAGKAGPSVRAATVEQILSASEGGYQPILRQCPVWADPFRFVVAQGRLVAALGALDSGQSVSERVRAVEQLVGVVSTEPEDRTGATVAAADRLVALLFDPAESPELRSRAAWGLGQLKYPPQAVLDRMGDLIATDSETAYVRASAVDALANLGHDPATAVLRSALVRPGAAAVAPEIVGALARLRDAASLPLLVEMAGQPDERLCRAAFAALPAFGGDALRPHSAALTAALTASMRHASADVRRAGVGFAGSAGSFGTLTAILGLLSGDPEPRVRESAAYAIGRALERKEIGDPARDSAVSRLLEASAGGPAEVRAAALWSLGHAGIPRAEERLINVVRNTGEPVAVRVAAAEGLGLARSEKGVRVLAEILRRPEAASLSTAAANALGAIGSPAAAEALLTTVADNKIPAEVRSSAQRAMERIDPASASIARLDDKSPAVRLETIRLIGETRNAQFAPKLVEKLGDPDAEVRAAAAEALMPVADEPLTVQALIAAMDKPDSLQSAGAAGVLGASMVRAARVALIAALNSSKAPALRAGAVDGLARQAAAGYNPDEVGAAIRTAAGDSSAMVRLSSARALGVLGGAEAEELLRRMTLDPAPEVRAAALEALAQRGRTKK